MNVFMYSLTYFSLFAIAFADYSCFFPTLSGKELDRAQHQLSHLNAVLQGKTYTTEFQIDGNQTPTKFSFSLCGNPLPSSCTVHANETIVMDEPDKKCSVIGRFNETNVALSNSYTWMAMTFSGGDKRNGTTGAMEATITFVCDPSNDALMLVPCSGLMKQEYHYSFVLHTNKLCEKPPVEGLSGGSVFCIIFFTVAGVYFLFGFLYQRLVVRAKGVEQIPNYDRWKEFGNLVADGCDFMCRCGSRQEAKMYQGIDDPLGHDESEAEERDDRLLPM